MSRISQRCSLRPTNENIKQKYLSSLQKYINCQFTFNTHYLIIKLVQNAKKQPQMQFVPIYKILIEICKVMMFNQLELLFLGIKYQFNLGTTVQQMNWQIIDNCLNPYLIQILDLTNQLPKDIYCKKIQFSLLLIAYVIKMYLNDEYQIFQYRIRQFVKGNFDKLYQQWVQRFRSHIHFSPKKINKLLKGIDKERKKQIETIIDYNRLVNELFDQSDIIKEQSSMDYRKIGDDKRQNKKNKVVEQHYDFRQKQEMNHLEQEDNYCQDDGEIPNILTRSKSDRSQMLNAGFTKRQTNDVFFEKNEEFVGNNFNSINNNNNNNNLHHNNRQTLSFIRNYSLDDSML